MDFGNKGDDAGEAGEVDEFDRNVEDNTKLSSRTSVDSYT